MMLENDIFFFINRTIENPVFNFLCPVLRDKRTWIPLYVLLAFMLLKRDSKSGLIWVVVAVLTAVASDQISMLFKNYFERIRPCHDEEILHWLRISVRCPDSFSFVSAHACSHFAQAFLYHHLFKNKHASILFFTWAFVISLSQVYVGVHYPSDVLAGAVLGLIIGFVMSKFGTLLLEKIRSRKE